MLDSVRAQFSTTSADEAANYLSERFRPHRCEKFALERFSLDSTCTTFRSMSFGRIRFGGRSTAVVGEHDTVVIIRVTAGKLTIDDEVRLSAGDTILVPHRAYTSLRDDVECEAVSFPAEHLRRAAAELTGARDFRFVGDRPISTDAARHWLATMHYFEANVTTPHPLVVGGAFQALATAALAAFPNTATSGRPLAPVRPPTVRRAAEFIHANAGRAVTLGEIAAVANVSPRALQYAFRRHFGATPMEYHRLARLDAAHRELSRASSEATVTAIAAKCGFLNPGRFSAFYKKIYGVSPSYTLKEGH